MRARTMVKATTGVAMIAAATVAAMVVSQNIQYALYSIVAVSVCAGAMLLLLEPELHDHRHR